MLCSGYDCLKLGYSKVIHTLSLCCSFEEDQGLLYYFNFRSGETRWEHPLDALYRDKVTLARKQAAAAGKTNMSYGYYITFHPPSFASRCTAVEVALLHWTHLSATLELSVPLIPYWPH